MKTLNDITQKAIKEVMKQYGAFWCFSAKQFEEQREPGKEYGNCGAGLVCYKGKGGELIDAMDKVYKEGFKQWVEMYGLDAIILYELNNHECFYTYDASDAVDKLAPYGVSEEQVLEVFRKNL